MLKYILDNICYIANVGDSRVILSADSGKKIIQISNDHKPNEYLERKRIIDAGGSVYQ
jgi:protein phosphatase PTC2/3